MTLGYKIVNLPKKQNLIIFFNSGILLPGLHIVY